MATGSPIQLEGHLGPDRSCELHERFCEVFRGASGDIGGVDLSGCLSLCTGTIQLLLAFRRELHGKGIQLRLVGGSPHVEEVLELAGLTAGQTTNFP
jgi:anti-anti-sigma regulatory factor